VITQNRRHYLKTSQDVAFQFFGSPTVLHATSEQTDSRFCLLEQLTMPPGLASPYHRHHNEDEAFYVLEGQMRFVCDGEWMNAGPGTWVYGPRDIPRPPDSTSTCSARYRKRREPEWSAALLQ